MKKKLGIYFCTALFVILIFLSSEAAESCRKALRLCSELIVPSLFPFFVLSALLSRMGLPSALGRILAPLGQKLFGVSGAGMTALVVGLTGGYPMGAAYIADLHRSGMISTEEAEHLLGFCNNSGPSFILGAIGGGIFSSARIGFFLWAVHSLSAVLTGMILRKRSPLPPRSEFRLPHFSVDENFAKLLTGSVVQSVSSILNVCGFVLCFNILLSLLDSIGIVSSAAGFIAAHTGAELSLVRSLLCGFVELGCGVGQMRSLLPTPAVLSAAAFLLGWGGLSVHFQTFSLFSGTEIKGALHITGHLLSAGLAAIVAYLLAGVCFG